MLIAAPALAALIAAGAPLVHAVLPNSLSALGGAHAAAVRRAAGAVDGGGAAGQLPAARAAGARPRAAAGRAGAAAGACAAPARRPRWAARCSASTAPWARSGSRPPASRRRCSWRRRTRGRRRRSSASWRATRCPLPRARRARLRRRLGARRGAAGEPSWLQRLMAGVVGCARLRGGPVLLVAPRPAGGARWAPSRPTGAGVNIALLRPPAPAPPGAKPNVPPGRRPFRTRREHSRGGPPHCRHDRTARTALRATGPGDRPVLVVLAVCFAALTALTWRKWGVPEIDAGAELTTADLVKHGALLYQRRALLLRPARALLAGAQPSSSRHQLHHGLRLRPGAGGCDHRRLLRAGAAVAGAAERGPGERGAAGDRLLRHRLQLRAAAHQLRHVRAAVCCWHCSRWPASACCSPASRPASCASRAPNSPRVAAGGAGGLRARHAGASRAAPRR